MLQLFIWNCFYHSRRFLFYCIYIPKMLIIFFNNKRIALRCTRGTKVNAQYYLGILHRLYNRVRRARPQVWKEKSWILHYNNVLSHTLIAVQEFLTRFNITILNYPPYSRDLALYDFFLFPKIKNIMRQHFGDVDTKRNDENDKINFNWRAAALFCPMEKSLE